MSKFIIAKTGEEVHIGDTMQRTESYKFSFGTIKTIESVTLTESNIQSFIEEGSIKVVDTAQEKKTRRAAKFPHDNVGYYVMLAAQRLQCDEKEFAEWLNSMNNAYPKAVLDILLETIAIRFYNEDPQAFDDAENYYSLRPRDGKVGKVTKIHSHIPLFKSAEDAERARNILKGQLELMYGEQEDN